MAFFITWVLTGVAGSILMILAGKKLNIITQLFSCSLLIAAIWYLFFGIQLQINIQLLYPQMIAGLFFAFCAWRGWQGSLFFIGIGWLTHGVWDLISNTMLSATYVPDLTLPACLGFDLVSGLYFLYQHIKHQPND